MAYESPSFKEHAEVRLPLLEKLLELGWKREQIICPSPGSADTEWRVPKSPSEATRREKGERFEGYPCDIAMFDDPNHVGEPNHVIILFECKQPGEGAGVEQLETYLGLEPHARLGIWTNGTSFKRVYKLADGTFSEPVEDTRLPSPAENLILVGKPVSYEGMSVPTERQLTASFSNLLDLIVARDSRSTRSDDRLNEICDMLLVKLDSDAAARRFPEKPVAFQVGGSPAETAVAVNRQFEAYRRRHRALFDANEPASIAFDDETIHAVVAELQKWNLAEMSPVALSLAFQVFRNANLKVGDGQYFTPMRVVEAGTAMMGIDARDRVIDPACGTGGFLCQAFLSVAGQEGEAEASRWAHDNLFGVDLDDINIKLTRSLMVGIGDGATNAYLGDSLRESKWGSETHGIRDALGDGGYTVVLTNPPFGKGLKLSAADARVGGYSVCRHTKAGKPSGSYESTELGIAFVERAWRLLESGGRLGIVLPETYFFSASYEWFRSWLDEHFALLGVLNIPMEAFQGFCRAKTNFYVFQKLGGDLTEAVEKLPPWLIDSKTWVSNAPTIGINKDGDELFKIDERTRRRLPELDDVAADDVRSLCSGDGETLTATFVDRREVAGSLLGVPQYWDRSSVAALESWMRDKLPRCSPASLGELADAGGLRVRPGHGSPSSDMRNGDIPYVKVSDLRSGLVNVNPTNMVPRAVAEGFWKGKTSGLAPWSVLTPARASKNIGEPVMLLPGQEEVVLTKEVVVLTVAESAAFDPFYLIWALSLRHVLDQWGRVVFMQTNREDLGDRWREIIVPVPESREEARRLSEPHRAYYTRLASLRGELEASLAGQGLE